MSLCHRNEYLYSSLIINLVKLEWKSVSEQVLEHVGFDVGWAIRAASSRETRLHHGETICQSAYSTRHLLPRLRQMHMEHKEHVLDESSFRTAPNESNEYS